MQKHMYKSTNLILDAKAHIQEHELDPRHNAHTQEHKSPDAKARALGDKLDLRCTRTGARKRAKKLSLDVTHAQEQEKSTDLILNEKARAEKHAKEHAQELTFRRAGKCTFLCVQESKHSF